MSLTGGSQVRKDNAGAYEYLDHPMTLHDNIMVTGLENGRRLGSDPKNQTTKAF